MPPTLRNKFSETALYSYSETLKHLTHSSGFAPLPLCQGGGGYTKKHSFTLAPQGRRPSVQTFTQSINIPMATIYDFKALASNGKEIDFADYQGKVLMIINTASKCGFTPQFEGLEKLHEKYADRGLVMIGFPCNQFAEQDPGTDGEIQEFCQVNYGVTPSSPGSRSRRPPKSTRVSKPKPQPPFSRPSARVSRRKATSSGISPNSSSHATAPVSSVLPPPPSPTRLSRPSRPFSKA